MIDDIKYKLVVAKANGNVKEFSKNLKTFDYLTDSEHVDIYGKSDLSSDYILTKTSKLDVYLNDYQAGADQGIVRKNY